MHMFKTGYVDIVKSISSINPEDYARSRNYIDGAVTYLSPYISRGVISTKMIYQFLIEKGYDLRQVEKFIQELAWRDYWQQVWLAKGDAIDKDLRFQQPRVAHYNIPSAIIEMATGIDVIDESISQLYKTGYMHNHLRMYLASMACVQAQSHWSTPAKWMYYHLLDGDWASNALSWQWVAGANSNKQYVANQENINKYTKTKQTGTFLDVSYESLPLKVIPKSLQATTLFDWQTTLPNQTALQINAAWPSLIYNSYNLDPLWRADQNANRILLLEPSHFEKYPVSEKVLQFVLDLSKNITNIQIYVGEFADLHGLVSGNIYYKEHPTANHYKGTEDARDWMFTVNGYDHSFFKFWKKCKKEIPF